MKARLIRIGNSRGIRLPKPLIEEANLSEEVTLKVIDNTIVIASVGAPRAGWEAAARLLSKTGDEPPVDAPVPTRFDEREWEW